MVIMNKVLISKTKIFIVRLQENANPSKNDTGS